MPSIIRELFPEDPPPPRIDAPDVPVRTVRTEQVEQVEQVESPNVVSLRASLQASLRDVAALQQPDLIEVREAALQPLPPVEARVEAPAELTVDQLLAGLPFAFLQGPAGTGKTWLARQLVRERSDAVLLATTGIAAVNLGDASTINSALAYFDTHSMMEHYASGFLQHRLRQLRRSGIRLLVLDEVSMLDADQLSLLCQAMDELDQHKTHDQDLGIGYTYSDGDLRMKLLLVGDFAQLPPVKASFAFTSPEWGRFAEQEFKLTTIRRQGDQRFIEGLQAVRLGRGREALPIFAPQMTNRLDFDFDGTTLVGTNAEVDRINGLRHAKLPGEPITWKTIRSGEQEKEWLKHLPEVVSLKPGALVMILANRAYPKDEADENPLNTLIYANGELATVIGPDPHGIRVMLHRTFAEVVVTPFVKEWKEPTGKKNPRWTIKGAVQYMPLRLAYATTVHKSQGLSLDAVQVSLINWTFGKPGMTYVALSRCRSLEGLRIVGNARLFLGKCGTDPKVQRYL